MKNRNIFVAVILSTIFFIVGLLSLPHYGPNWDEPIHFGRGQAILHYLLTGRKNYFDIKPTHRRSYYQYNYFSFEYFESRFSDYSKGIAGAGHPPFSDVLAAVSNYIFYQKLGIVGDVEAHHLYSVVLAASLVGILYYVMSQTYGIFAGLITALSLALTPLFLAESRFNIKDVPETVFYAITILAFYKGMVRTSWKWIVVSAFFAGMAFGTKLNIVFAILTIGVWFFIVSLYKIRRLGWKKFVRCHRALLVTFPCFGIFSLAIYFGTWPILWQDPLNRFLYNLNYYKTIGIGGAPGGFTTVLGINTYAIQWILFSTPLVVLILAGMGMLVGIWAKEKRNFFLLVLLWFLIPIIRVSLPSASIYGGVRQIMEYIPAMAMLAGIGATTIVTWLGKWLKGHLSIQPFLQAIILLSFIPITFKIISMYPNESIYFNPLIGGLKGAAARNIPGWGNSLGSTYLQGVKWLNANAETNARLALVFELRSNISPFYLRKDIEFANNLRSIIRREGEYLIGVTHGGTQEDTYNRLYLERYLHPVYQVVVDGVSVLKIWKNDLDHTKEEYKQPEQVLASASVSKDDRRVIIDLGELVKLTRIRIAYDSTDCILPTNGHFEYTTSNPPLWQRVSGDFQIIPFMTWFKIQPEPGILEYLFAAEDARYLQMIINDQNSCLLNKPLDIRIYTI